MIPAPFEYVRVHSVDGAVAAEVGDPQVRHRGTIGGSVAHGDPASDLFFGFLETAIDDDELLVEVRVPRCGTAGFDFRKFRRRAQDWAIVGALTIRVGDSTRVALVNMGATPLRARAVEDALAGGAGPEEAAAFAADGTDPPADLHADTDFRAHLARVLVARTLAATS